MEDILANIKSIIDSSLAESVLQRLDSFKYKVTESDTWSICFAIQKVENRIKNFCNITSIPVGLTNTAVDMACGEFLYIKKQTGQLAIEDLDLSNAIQQISEGDTSVTFSSGASDEDRFNDVLNYLLHDGEGDLLCYRKLKW